MRPSPPRLREAALSLFILRAGCCLPWFAGKQTISLVAEADAQREPRFSFLSGNAMAPDLLRSACVFGANAAGKPAKGNALFFSTVIQLNTDVFKKPFEWIKDIYG